MEIILPSDFKSLDNIIANHRADFMRVGFALCKVRDLKLWSEGGFASFDEYAKDRMGFGKSQANRLISSAFGKSQNATIRNPTHNAPDVKNLPCKDVNKELNRATDATLPPNTQQSPKIREVPIPADDFDFDSEPPNPLESFIADCDAIHQQVAEVVIKVRQVLKIKGNEITEPLGERFTMLGTYNGLKEWNRAWNDATPAGLTNDGKIVTRFEQARDAKGKK